VIYACSDGAGAGILLEWSELAPRLWNFWEPRKFATHDTRRPWHILDTISLFQPALQPAASLGKRDHLPGQPKLCLRDRTRAANRCRAGIYAIISLHWRELGT
jgi:hypothetical protein